MNIKAQSRADKTDVSNRLAASRETNPLSRVLHPLTVAAVLCGNIGNFRL